MIKDRGILYLAMAQTLAWAGLYYIFPALLVRWEQTLGWSKADLTGAITLALFLSACASPVAGKLIDLGKGPIMMAGSTALGGLCLFMLSFATTPAVFYLIWGIIGITLAGSLYEPCFALITRAYGSHAKRGIIWVTLIAGFASTICFPMTHLLAEVFGWQHTIRIFAAMVICFAAPLMWKGAQRVERSNPRNRIEKKQQASTYVAFVRTWVFWSLALGFAFVAVIHGVTLHHLLAILHDQAIQPAVAVTAAAFIGPMQVVGRLVMVIFERHVSVHRITVGCFVGIGGSVVFLLSAGDTPALLIGFVILFGGSYGIVSIIRPLIARQLLGEGNFGAKSGALALFYLTGSAFAPFLGSLVWIMGGYGLVLPLLFILSLFGLGLYLATHRLNTT